MRMTTACGVYGQDLVEPVKTFLAVVDTLSEVHVQQDHVVLLLRKQLWDPFGVALDLDRRELLLQEHAGTLQHVTVVIDYQYFRLIHRD